MAAHLPGSALVLDDAIGPYRDALADLIGASRDTLDLWCLPPPDFSPAGRSNRGRRNPLDELAAIVRNCPNGRYALDWLCQQLGGRFIRPAQRDLVASAAILVDEAEQLAREGDRRKRKLTDAQVRDLRDQITDQVHAIAERLFALPGKAPK